MDPSSAAPTLLLAILLVSGPPAQTGAVLEQEAGARAKYAYGRAIELETEGNYAGALALLWEAATLGPRDADVQNRLGEALDRMGALDAAVDAYRRALSERPDFRKASNNLILALAKAGKGQEAVDLARARVAAAPEDPDRHFTLGLAQSEQDVAEAIKSFRRVLELAPRHSLARYNLALVLRRVDRLSEALEELRRARAIEARPEIHYMIGVIHWHQGDLDRAETALGAALAAEPGHVDAHHALGSVFKARRDWTRAGASLRRAIALRPDLPAAHYTLAQVLRLAGDEAGAATHLAEADRLHHRAEVERSASVLTAVGIQKLEAGDLTGALDQFQAATKAFDRYAPAHYQLGRVLQRLGQTKAARAAFARAAALNPSLVPPRDAQGPESNR
jgi:tetratricopeptide (TPR) repeat protein